MRHDWEHIRRRGGAETLPFLTQPASLTEIATRRPRERVNDRQSPIKKQNAKAEPGSDYDQSPFHQHQTPPTYSAHMVLPISAPPATITITTPPQSHQGDVQGERKVTRGERRTGEAMAEAKSKQEAAGKRRRAGRTSRRVKERAHGGAEATRTLEKITLARNMKGRLKETGRCYLSGNLRASREATQAEGDRKKKQQGKKTREEG
ncbi:hypothetical protein E2C01_001171 [Portunus trituberculatus]|uniref:Uncharacterized protein n=1 Tax=Portunus trituberculatus TaxID=210409 RepID=A0A5B7CLW0_PORTR|nr:hypothetical protein [Portunus trituberculatus]